MGATVKKCFRCKETKGISRFYKNRANADGFTSYCRECHKRIFKGVDAKILKERYYQDPVCEHCGIVFGHPQEMQLDHRVPRHRGGVNVVDNIAFACPQCNRMKYDMTDVEFKNFLLTYWSRLTEKFKVKIVPDAKEEVS